MVEPSQKKRTEVRREEIVGAALRVIAERGVSGVTTAAIAEAAGMCEANLYRHFPGKEAILRQVADHVGGTFSGRAAAIAAGRGSPLAKLRATILGHLRLIEENPVLPRLLFSEEVQLGSRPVAEVLLGHMASYLATLEGLVAAARADGELRPGASPRETALTLLGIVSFTALRHALSGGSLDVAREGERLWANFEALIR